MQGLLLIILTVVITWSLLHTLIYGHKAQVNRLWEEIFRYSHEIAKWQKNPGFSDVTLILKHKADRAGKLINALLDYHYADIEDEEKQEYVNENSYEGKN